MAIDYLPLLIFVLIAAGFAAIAIIVPTLLGPRRANKQKLEPYESGIIPYSDARRRFPVKFYLVAMLFISHCFSGVSVSSCTICILTDEVVLAKIDSMVVDALR